MAASRGISALVFKEHIYLSGILGGLGAAKSGCDYGYDDYYINYEINAEIIFLNKLYITRVQSFRHQKGLGAQTPLHSYVDKHFFVVHYSFKLIQIINKRLKKK